MLQPLILIKDTVPNPGRRQGYKGPPAQKFWRYLRFSRSLFRCLQRDLVTVRNADVILAMSPWEAKHYLRWIAPRRSVVLAPYFCPADIEAQIKPHTAKIDQCVLPLSVQRTPFDALVEKQGRQVIKQISGTLKGWKFLVTGESSKAKGNARSHKVLTYIGVSDRYFHEINRSKTTLVPILPRAGFKTRYVEAVAVGHSLIVPHGLEKRLYEPLRRRAIGVDLASPQSVARAITTLITMASTKKDTIPVFLLFNFNLYLGNQ